MTIIAQSGATVNVFLQQKVQYNPVKTAKKLERAALKRAERAEDEKKPAAQRWTEHKKLSLDVGDRLIKAGLPKRGNRIKMCGNQLTITHCPQCGQIKIAGAQLCRDKLCPTCAWRLAIKRYAAMQAIMRLLYTRYPGYTYSLVTLTARNCGRGELGAYLDKMQKAWESVRQQRWARRSLTGWARAIECTYSKDCAAGCYHPHYHIIIMYDDKHHHGTDSAVIQEWLRQCSRQGITATLKAQDTQRITSIDAGQSLAGAICEVYKYSIKASDTLEMPLDVLYDFAIALQGKRMVSFGGAIKQAAKDLQLEQLEQADEDEREELCTACGCKALDHMIARWSMAGMHYYTIQGRELCAEVEALERKREEDALLHTDGR